jgi:conjugal transfer/entry exclusion protein
MRYRVMLLVCAVVALAGSHASGQILGTGVMPVTEVGVDLYQNTITATQSVLSVKNELLNLLPLDVIFIVDDIMADMSALGAIIQDAQALAFDLQSLNAQIRLLFDLETAPTTRSALDQRIADIRRWVFDSRVLAARAQTLMTTITCTVNHLQTLVRDIGAFAGEKQALQALNQTETVIAKTLAITQVQATTMQRADIVERMSREIVIESLRKMEAQRMRDWTVGAGG